METFPLIRLISREIDDLADDTGEVGSASHWELSALAEYISNISGLPVRILPDLCDGGISIELDGTLLAVSPSFSGVDVKPADSKYAAALANLLTSYVPEVQHSLAEMCDVAAAADEWNAKIRADPSPAAAATLEPEVQHDDPGWVEDIFRELDCFIARPSATTAADVRDTIYGCTTQRPLVDAPMVVVLVQDDFAPAAVSCWADGSLTITDIGEQCDDVTWVLRRPGSRQAPIPSVGNFPARPGSGDNPTAAIWRALNAYITDPEDEQIPAIDAAIRNHPNITVSGMTHTEVLLLPIDEDPRVCTLYPNPSSNPMDIELVGDKVISPDYVLRQIANDDDNGAD